MSLIFLSASRNLYRQRLVYTSVRLLSSNPINNDLLQVEKQQQKQKQQQQQSPRVRRYHYYLLSIATGALIGTIYALRQVRKHEGVLPEYVANPALLERKAMDSRPLPPPAAKRVTFDAPPRQHFPFNVTLYQYVTCPFCCKVRAFLNYNRIPYDIVEVNSILHTETKWSFYDRVPIVVIENESLQLNDSSLIISTIESYLREPTKTFKNITKLYQSVVEKDPKGKLNFSYPNRYEIVDVPLANRLELTTRVNEQTAIQPQSQSFFARLFSRSKAPSLEPIPGSKQSIKKQRTLEENQLERQWREWVDNKFIHVLSPNIYWTLQQSLDTFRWFSKAGEWDDIFPWYQRWFIVYAGAIVMRLVAIRLKKKYQLNDNVRLSLYECGDEWANAVGDKDFLGGSEPNLADLNVYGILTAIQGCEAFDDLMKNTKIGPWFERMRNLIEPHRIDTPVRSTLS